MEDFYHGKKLKHFSILDNLVPFSSYKCSQANSPTIEAALRKNYTFDKGEKKHAVFCRFAFVPSVIQLKW